MANRSTQIYILSVIGFPSLIWTFLEVKNTLIQYPLTSLTVLRIGSISLHQFPFLNQTFM